jgi:phage FluMu protein Com
MSDKIMSESMGGEVGEFIKNWSGKTIRCFGTCRSKQKMLEFQGYLHEGGLSDASGQKWWVFFKCPKCKYGHSFSKMNFFLEHTKVEEDAEKRYKGARKW